jgi:hypothetical protein
MALTAAQIADICILFSAIYIFSMVQGCANRPMMVRKQP